MRTFLVLARTGSFTEAAAELRVVQSTVSDQIRTLERELDLRLFDRLPRGTRLTDAGREVVAHARELLDSQRRLFDAARQDGAVAGEVTVGATESTCAYRLPGVVAALSQRHPDVHVHLSPAGTSAALAGVSRADAGLDAALVLEEAPATDHTLRPLGREPVELVAAPGHPAATGHHTWRDLADHSHFLLEEGCSYTDRVARELLAASPARPRIARFGSIEAARSCVEAGLGLSVLPRVAVAAHLAEGSLCRVTGPALPDVPLYLVTNRRRWPSPAVTTVVEAITEAAASW
ncbi:DNA-binding transcriptional LysR family regulator [Haloactinospora alba]|uniref:DNA-binding transcriptional LysR family regulator n=1 Tax=Haloactinospora alba TaxID=405555 RepID=A0A543NNE6_9ACTN|nr:DNA-binding transcriptional LysR family regulator [Haloactinospora alba]